MLRVSMFAIAVIVSQGWCMSIQELPSRTFKEAYSKRNSLRPEVHRTIDQLSDFNIAPRDNVTMYYGPAEGSKLI
jgi:hypothetical protein